MSTEPGQLQFLVFLGKTLLPKSKAFNHYLAHEGLIHCRFAGPVGLCYFALLEIALIPYHSKDA